jgi:hypothetical protein
MPARRLPTRRRQLGDVGRDPPRLILVEQLGGLIQVPVSYEAPPNSSMKARALAGSEKHQ